MKDVSKLPNVEKLQEQKPAPYKSSFFDGKNKDEHIKKQGAYIAKLEAAVKQLHGTVTKDAMHGHQVPSMTKALNAAADDKMVAVAKAINSEKLLAADHRRALEDILINSERQGRDTAIENRALLDERDALKTTFANKEKSYQAEIQGLKVSLAGSEERFKEVTRDMRGLPLDHVAERLQGALVKTVKYTDKAGQQQDGKVYDIPTARGDVRVLIGSSSKGDFFQVMDGKSSAKFGAINLTMATKGCDFMQAVGVLKSYGAALESDTVNSRVREVTASIKADVTKELSEAMTASQAMSSRGSARASRGWDRG